ncbi:Folylpolyglutamate synthetase [Lobulomyces angularis]|nr:Folylpolyglutamate synthetase [Lobulomyces angularis]
MISYVNRCGYEPSDFNKLNIIHIAGTKGKGSTSALTDSILRQYSIKEKDIVRPIKTGLYSSPHLMEVRERIRLNGKPISKELFSKYFFEVWEKLEQTKNFHLPTKKNEVLQNLQENLKVENSKLNFTNTDATDAPPPSDKPTYFRYLTLLSFHVFMREQVDVAVFEVGVGGTYDSTNIIEKPLVTGITSLGLDHTTVLGNTLPEIASHKAGIMKSGVSCFSSVQPPDAEEVLIKRSQILKAKSLTFVRNTELILPDNIEIGLSGSHQRVNSALAVSLCKETLKQFNDINTEKKIVFFKNNAEDNENLSPEMLKGLKNVNWPGRAQTFQSKKIFPSIKWYLDGAHTADSLAACARWVENCVLPDSSELCLIFNCTGGRNVEALLKPLADLYNKTKIFKLVIFCTNETYNNPDNVWAPDLTNNTTFKDENLTAQKTLLQEFKNLINQTEEVKLLVSKSIEDAILLVDKNKFSHVLVTGSLHLVGGVLTYLEAEVC